MSEPSCTEVPKRSTSAPSVISAVMGNSCGNSICRVQRDRKPDSLAISFRNALTPQEITCGVRATHLVTQVAFSKLCRQAEIMQHSRDVEKFRVKNQTLALACQRRPIIDAHGALKQKIALGTANELSCVARQSDVGNSYARNLSVAVGTG
jgi:hypothetical protein